jgi:hypothetical protein
MIPMGGRVFVGGNVAGLFVCPNFKASQLHPEFYEYLTSLPDEIIVLLEFISPGPNRRQVDCAILGPRGVDVIEVKNHPGEIRGRANGDWEQTIHGRTNSIRNTRGGVNENPYDQAQNISDDLKQWLEGTLKLRNVKFRATVLLPAGNPRSSFEEHNYVRYANGVDELPKVLLNCHRGRRVWEYRQYSNVAERLGLKEFGLSYFTGHVINGSSNEGLSGVSVAVSGIEHRLTTDTDGKFYAVLRANEPVEIHIIPPSASYDEHKCMETPLQGKEVRSYPLHPKPQFDTHVVKELADLKERLRQQEAELVGRLQGSQAHAQGAIREELDELRQLISELQNGHSQRDDAVRAALDFLERHQRSWRSSASQLLASGYHDYVAGLDGLSDAELALLAATLKNTTLMKVSVDSVGKGAVQIGQVIGKATRGVGSLLQRTKLASPDTSTIEPRLRAAREKLKGSFAPHLFAAASRFRTISDRIHLDDLTRTFQTVQLQIEHDAGELAKLGHDRLKRELSDLIGRRLGIETHVDDEYWFRLLLNRIAPSYGIDQSYYKTVELTQRVFTAVMSEVEEQARKQVRELDREQEEALVKELDAKLSQMTSEQQRVIMQDLGVDRLSGRILLQSFTSGGVAFGVFTAASSTGFGLYLAATTITHAIATTMFGVTLSFGTYTGLTSAIAFILSPAVSTAIIMASMGSVLFIKGKQLPPKITGVILAQVLNKRLLQLVEGERSATGNPTPSTMSM